MKLQISENILNRIHAHGEKAYPEEGAGFLLGWDDGVSRQVVDIIPMANAREDNARHNRYLITPQDMLEGEKEANGKELDIVGVFHSHPNHPNRPSEFDREWAMPWLSYVITSVNEGQALGSRSWRLADNREKFIEEEIILESVQSKYEIHNTKKSSLLDSYGEKPKLIFGDKSMTTLRIPTPLRPYAEGATEIQVQAETVGQALDALTAKYPSLRTHLFSEEGDLRPFVNLFLNDEDIRYLKGAHTTLTDGDKLMILPNIAGGC